jgi:EAL domain-containing protein (putative c-di-GMP-specific phosphodiesterase class I)
MLIKPFTIFQLIEEIIENSLYFKLYHSNLYYMNHINNIDNNYDKDNNNEEDIVLFNNKLFLAIHNEKELSNDFIKSNPDNKEFLLVFNIDFKEMAATYGFLNKEKVKKFILLDMAQYFKEKYKIYITDEERIVLKISENNNYNLLTKKGLELFKSSIEYYFVDTFKDFLENKKYLIEFKQDNNIKQVEIFFLFNVFIMPVISNSNIIDNLKKIQLNKSIRKIFFIEQFDLEAINKTIDNNIEMSNVISEGLLNKNFISYFQPIYDNKTKEIVKYESLIRLKMNNEVLLPFKFLDLSKKTGKYYKIQEEVFKYAIEMIKRKDICISVNISFDEISNEKTYNKLIEILDENKQYVSKLSFEILEDTKITDIEVIKKFINTMREEYNIKVGLDDFGVDFSNLELLIKLGVDFIKFDGELIKNINTNIMAYNLLKYIVKFLKESNILTVAEFVENEDIYNLVKELEIDYSQGYHFSKPIELI